MGIKQPADGSHDFAVKQKLFYQPNYTVTNGSPFTKNIMKIIHWKFNDRWVFTLAIATIFFTASSCYYEQVVPAEVEVPTEVISYDLDIQPFFDAKCTSCHGGSVSPNLSRGVSYQELVSGDWIDAEVAEDSPLYQSIAVGGSMEGYATPSERATLLAWIEQGASDN